MLQTIAEAAVICVVIAVLAYLTGMAVAYALEQRTADGMRRENLEERLQRLHTLATRFQKRRETLLPQMVKLDARVKSARRRHYMVSKRVTDLSVGRSSLIRVLGEEDAFTRAERPARRFEAHVINRHVQRAQLDQKEHPFLARSWGRSQRVDIWAPTIGDAKVAVEKAFPPATGFYVIEISEPEVEEPGDGDDALLPVTDAALP